MGGNDNAIVSTKAGQLEGLVEDDLVVFRGVRYATPPIGPRRWMPPALLPGLFRGVA